jgi:aminoglycoside phosphotransferase (APT) family kinase protein
VLSENTRRWIEGATGARVVSVAVLAGATSSLLHTVEVEGATGRRSLVLRRFVNENWVKAEPDVAIREGMSLQHATRAGLPAPELIALDASGEHCGAPATLVARLEGSVVLEPAHRQQWLRGLAETAARIHRVDAAGFRWKYRRYNEGAALTIPRWSKRQDAWAKAIKIVEGPPRSYSECFVHRDYHPSNVLWQNGCVSGVVDWVNGCRGPAGIDVAWCRHNLASLHGVPVADEFLEVYVAESGSEFTYDPYWDLMSVVELLPGPPSMYEGWRAIGVPNISNAVMRGRVDDYVASVVARI